VAGGLDDVVLAAHEPEIPLRIAPREVRIPLEDGTELLLVHASPASPFFREMLGQLYASTGSWAEALPEFEAAVRNPLYKTPEIALINAGRCAGSLGENRQAEQYFKRALAVSPNNPEAALSLSQLNYKEGRLPEARALMKPVMLQTNPPPEALALGACIERKMGDRSAEASYISQLRNRYPDSAEAKSIATGGCE